MISVVITAAGNSTRFGKEKLFYLIGKDPIFIRTIKQFVKVKEIGEIILVVKKETRKRFEYWLRKSKLKPIIIEGGKERYESAYFGVKAAHGEFVLIHDCARPLVTPKLIRAVANAVQEHHAVMSAIEATTCVKIVDRETMKVKQCLDRKTSWLGQTPHAFKKDIILRAYEKAIQGEIYGMDDCELVRKTGVDVVVVEGEWTNKKVTLQADLDVIRSWSKYV